MASSLGSPIPALVAAALGAAWAGALWRLGAAEHPAVLNWRRLARRHGVEDRPPLVERVGDRLPRLRRALAESDLRRLLTVAGSPQTPAAWLLRTAALAAAAPVAVLGLDGLGLLWTERLPLAPGWGLAAGAAIGALAYCRLRQAAADRRRRLALAIADALPQVAVTTYHHRLPAGEALLICARCQTDGGLSRLLSGGGWETLESRPSASEAQGSAALYERIGRALGVPAFQALAAATRLVSERGLSSQEVFTRLARDSLSERAVEARVAAARARTLIVIPMGLMILPLLVLIGAPLVAQLQALFGP